MWNRTKKIAKRILTALGLYGLYVRLRQWLSIPDMKRDALKAGFDVKWGGGKIKITKIREWKRVIISSRHAIYAWDIISDFERYFDAVIPEKLGNVDVVDYSRPQEHTLKGRDVTLYFPAFAENLSLLEQEYFCKYTPKEGDIVFDCGAYCGDATYLISKLVGDSGRVYAFEPDENNYLALVKNIEKHDLSNVIPVRKGIWSSTTTLQFTEENNLGGALTYIIGRRSPDISQVEVTSIVDAYHEFELSRLDLIKMDIEGAEIEAIEGSKDFLAEKNVHLVISSHMRNGRQTHEAFEKLLQGIGYETETGNPLGSPNLAGFVTWAQKIFLP